MIDSIGAAGSTNLMDAIRQITQTKQSMETGAASKLGGEDMGVKAPSFTDMLSQLVGGADAAQKTAEGEAKKIFTGESTNIHQAILSTQEAGVAFTLMTEVRNKLVSAYQELMRMQV